LQALILEKKIESLHITRSFGDRAEELSREVEELQDRIVRIGRLSNLALRLYGWYIQRGQVRDRSEGEDLRQFFHDNMPQDAAGRPGFYERLYLHQCHAWYGFIAQDLLLYYRSCRRWVDLFSEEPHMRKVEAQQYIKGMHNLLNAHFTLGNPAGFLESLRQFEDFSRSPEACMSLNNRVQTFVYLHLARINRHYMEGTFREGLLLVPEIEEGLEAYAMQIDRHRELVFYYKIACLYFGCGELGEAIRYLRRIIDGKADLRADIQCYARLLHLIAHYEAGNFDIRESLIKSVYRFMSRMQNLSAVEREILPTCGPCGKSCCLWSETRTPDDPSCTSTSSPGSIAPFWACPSRMSSGSATSGVPASPAAPDAAGRSRARPTPNNWAVSGDFHNFALLNLGMPASLPFALNTTY